jgi:hypothetical protein
MLSSMLAPNLDQVPSCFRVHCVPFGILFHGSRLFVEPTVHSHHYVRADFFT